MFLDVNDPGKKKARSKRHQEVCAKTGSQSKAVTTEKKRLCGEKGAEDARVDPGAGWMATARTPLNWGKEKTNKKKKLGKRGTPNSKGTEKPTGPESWKKKMQENHQQNGSNNTKYVDQLVGGGGFWVNPDERPPHVRGWRGAGDGEG